MSGNRQHTIPRFIQRGFSSKTVRDKTFTWVYRKNSEPFESNVLNVGVEGKFYTDGDDYILDDQITSYEYGLSELVEQLRSSGRVGDVNADDIAALIAHLEVRSRHIRHSFSNSTNAMFKKFMDFMGDASSRSSWLKNISRGDDSPLVKAMEKELERRGIPGKYATMLVQSNADAIEKDIEKLSQSLLPRVFENLYEGTPSMIKSSLKSGQIKALSKSLAPLSRVDVYKNLHYKIFEVSNESLILGDSVVLFHVDSERGFRPSFSGSETIEAIYLPLSLNQLLVGSKCREYSPDFDAFPKEVSRCSLEYFISHSCSERNLEYAELIGLNAHLLSDDQIDDVVRKQFFPVG